MDKYISKFSLKDIIYLESQDLQFLSLQNAWKNISEKSTNKITDQNLFLFLILQNGLVSYQIAGSGENRREEFSQKIVQDREMISKTLLNNNNIDRRYEFLTTSKYNKRIYNIKKSRLVRFNKFLEELDWDDDKFFLNYYQNMNGLLSKISQIMDRPADSKTLTFTVKMFGYGSRIIFEKIVYYPHQIKIPIDSRLKKIYEINTGKKLLNNIADKKLIGKYFEDLSKKHNIPALHLDSILWIDYWKNHIQK
ncbi:MAG: N-glycosylase/DNA lyase [Candidatus Absconditicoccaceae bacterium]